MSESYLIIFHGSSTGSAERARCNRKPPPPGLSAGRPPTGPRTSPSEAAREGEPELARASWAEVAGVVDRDGRGS